MSWYGYIQNPSNRAPPASVFLKKSAHGHKKSETFTDHKTADRMESVQRNAFFRSDLKNNPDTSDTRNLFNELAQRRDESVLFAVIITVDAGVDAARKQSEQVESQEAVRSVLPRENALRSSLR